MPIDFILLGASFEKEYATTFELPSDVTRNRIITIYPAYDGNPSYAEWKNMFEGKGW